MKRRFFIFSLPFLTSVGLSQTRPPRPQDRGPGRESFLDAQQQQIIQEVSEKNSSQLQKLEEQLRAAQKEFLQVVMSENPQEETLKTKAENVAKIQVEIMLLNAKSLEAVAPTLKPEQKEVFLNSRFDLSRGFGFNRFGPGFRGNLDSPPLR